MRYLNSGLAGPRSVGSLGLALMLLSGSLMPASTEAAEGGQSFYLFGLHGPLAAVAPPPGVYLQDDTLVYAAKASASEQLPYVGRITAGIKADAYINFPTLLWQTPLNFDGVHVGVTITQPFGDEYVVGRIVGGNNEASLQGTRVSAGDLALGMPLTWSSGRLNLGVTPSLNIPTGNYSTSELSNVALHRWAGDFSVAVTWLDKDIGLEASAIAGATFNGTNPTTDYRTGTEVHSELAVSQYLSPAFSLGTLVSYYQQVTDDSGSGDHLGGFKGRIWAAGGTASYTLAIHDTPIALRVKVLREFGVQNRTTGTSGILSIGVPL